MKLIRKPINELKYWSFVGNPKKDEKLIVSPYNILVHNSNIGVLYNTRVNSLVILDKNELLSYLEFEKMKNVDASTFSIELFENGFLNQSSCDEYRFMLEEITAPFQMQERTRQFTILPTQKCNARCFYCFENDVNRLRMEDNTAEQTVKFIVDNVKNLDSFNLDWFGGEPLIEFNKISSMIEKIQNSTTTPFTSSITTNATLFSEERVKIAVERWKLKRASITIDGLYEEHNSRKSVIGIENAFQTTINNIRYLLEFGVFVNLRVHIDKYNINQLVEILDYLSEFSDKSNFHLFVEKLFMPLQVEYHEDINRYILPEESEEFYKYMMIEMKKRGFVSDYDAFLASRRETSCMASRRDSILINSDGLLFNCEQEFYEVSNNIGDIWSGVSFNKRYFEMISPQIRGTECEKCMYLPTCLGGCRFTRSLCSSGHKYCMRGRILTPIAMNLLLNEYDNTDKETL